MKTCHEATRLGNKIRSDKVTMMVGNQPLKIQTKPAIARTGPIHYADEMTEEDLNFDEPGVPMPDIHANIMLKRRIRIIPRKEVASPEETKVSPESTRRRRVVATPKGFWGATKKNSSTTVNVASPTSTISVKKSPA